MNFIKRNAIALLDKALVKKGTVLDVRFWEPATICEIDLHLPLVDMTMWDSVHHIKIKVGELTFRDYTCVYWDAETHTCSLIIEIGHEGVGSNWAKHLSAGDSISYVGVGKSSHRPVNWEMLGFADISSMAHMLAIEYLSKLQGIGTMKGIVCFKEPHHVEEFKSYFHSGLQPKLIQENKYDSSWKTWLKDHTLLSQNIYIAGFIPSVAGFRKELKKQISYNGEVRAEGFWQ